MLYSVVLVSAVQQSESAICIHISPYPLPLKLPSKPFPKTGLVIVENVNQIMYFHHSNTFNGFPLQRITLFLIKTLKTFSCLLPFISHPSFLFCNAWPHSFPVCSCNMPCSFLPPLDLCDCRSLCKERTSPSLTASHLSGDQFSATWLERPLWQPTKECTHCQLFSFIVCCLFLS